MAVLAIATDPSSLDPQFADDRNQEYVNSNVYETLVFRSPQGKLIPWLAESWTVQNAATWRFKLRGGVKFHNGEPFNADAAVFSVKRIISPEEKSQWAATVTSIADARKVDDLTIDVITKIRDPLLPARCTQIGMMSPKWTQEAGQKAATTTNGTGPYKVTNWERGVAIDLVANADYWDGAPKIPAARVRIIPEDQTRLAALRSGEIDIAWGLTPEQWPQAPVLISQHVPDYVFVRLSNLPGSPIADKRIRQAMNYAVDKETILKQLLGGRGQVLPGQLAIPQVFGFNPTLKPYPYDPDRAKRLLAQAGAQGMSINLLGVQGRFVSDNIVSQAIGAMLEKVGLQVKVTILNNLQRLKLGDRKQTPDTPPVLVFGHDNYLFDADRTVAAYYSLEGSYSAYSNREIDLLIPQARSELDPKKREQLYWRIFAIGRDDPPMIFLHQLDAVWGTSRRIRWTPVPGLMVRFKDMTLTA